MLLVLWPGAGTLDEQSLEASSQGTGKRSWRCLPAVVSPADCWLLIGLLGILRVYVSCSLLCTQALVLWAYYDQRVSYVRRAMGRRAMEIYRSLLKVSAPGAP